MNTKSRVPIYTKTTASERNYKREGWPVGVISRQPVDDSSGFNHLTIIWSVNKMRKDYSETARQHRRKGNISRYSQSLFDSCFKNW